MPRPLFLLFLTALLHAAATWCWCRYVVPREVARNDADILANGAADDLRRGYHQRRSWVRFWWWLGLSVVPNAVLLPIGWLPALLGFLALGWLLAAYFGRYFTPLLNLARVASGRPDLSEWYCSGDSASWPDAAIWRTVRTTRIVLHTDKERQLIANDLLKQLLSRVWTWGRIGYGVLTAGAIMLAIFMQ